MLQTSLITPKAQAIIDRLSAIDSTKPKYSEEGIRSAFARHLAALQHPDRPVEIYFSFREGAAAWAAAIVNSTQESPRYQEFCAVWMPFVDAFDAGLFAYWVLPSKVIAVMSPCLKIQDNQLHSDGSAAVQWGNTEKYYFWKGVQIPEFYGSIASELWQSQWLLKEQNAELRRVLIEGIGYDLICQDLSAQKLDTWREYTLLKIDADIDLEPIHLLKMTCPSTQHIHSLRVPPDLYSAREAIRWINWGVDPDEISIAT